MSVIGEPTGAGRAQQVVDKGFLPSMFGYSGAGAAADLLTAVQDVVGLKELEVKARIGSDLYTSTDTDIAAAVDRAVVELAASEMWERRRTRVLANSNVSGDMRVRPGASEENSKQAALDAYEAAVSSVLSLGGVSADFATGSVVTSHFPEAG